MIEFILFLFLDTSINNSNQLLFISKVIIQHLNWIIISQVLKKTYHDVHSYPWLLPPMNGHTLKKTCRPLMIICYHLIVVWFGYILYYVLCHPKKPIECLKLCYTFCCTWMNIVNYELLQNTFKINLQIQGYIYTI